jgi:hypothetical protein
MAASPCLPLGAKHRSITSVRLGSLGLRYRGLTALCFPSFNVSQTVFSLRSRNILVEFGVV